MVGIGEPVSHGFAEFSERMVSVDELSSIARIVQRDKER